MPREANDGAALRANGSEPTVTWVGHATVLLQLDGVNLLTDPHWGRRASPISFAWRGRVAEALFDEWEAELNQYTSAPLRRSSERRLQETRAQYGQLIRAMTRAEAKMDPVLAAFHD